MKRANVRRLWVIALALTLIALGFAGAAALNNGPPLSERPPQGIPDIPQSVDFGTVLNGTLSEHMLSLTNPTPETLPLDHLLISCSCLKLACPAHAIPPHGTAQLRMALDLRSDPDFAGDLAIDISASDSRGEAVPLALIKVSVVPSNSHLPK
jgi:hypothetical protein